MTSHSSGLLLVLPGEAGVLGRDGAAARQHSKVLGVWARMSPLISLTSCLVKHLTHPSLLARDCSSQGWFVPPIFRGRGAEASAVAWPCMGAQPRPLAAAAHAAFAQHGLDMQDTAQSLCHTLLMPLSLTACGGGVYLKQFSEDGISQALSSVASLAIPSQELWSSFSLFIQQPSSR